MRALLFLGRAISWRSFRFLPGFSLMKGCLKRAPA